MRNLFLLFLIFLLCTAKVVAIEDCGCEHHHHSKIDIEVKKDSILNVRDCISIGIKNSPIIKEYAHKLEIAKSNVGIAKSVYFPEFGIGAGYRQEFNSNRIDFVRNYRELPNIGITLNKMIWDFGKATANIKMEEFLKIAAEYEFEDSVCSSVFEIKIYYYKLLKAQAVYEVQKTNYAIQNNIVKDLESLVQSGKKNKADLLNAKLSLQKCKVKLNNAEKNYKNAKEDLNNAMFLENAPQYKIYETQTFSYQPIEQHVFNNTNKKSQNLISKDDTIFKNPTYSSNKAVEIAYKNSPDIKVLIATKNAFEQALILVKRNYYPQLNTGLGYNFLNTNSFNNNGLSVAVTIDSTINAMKQKYETKYAKAQLDLAETEIETYKKNLNFIVRKNLNNVEDSYKNISIVHKEMQTAVEYFDTTYQNYKNNLMNQLEMENAKDLYIQSLYDYINSQFEYNISLIRLEMSMHEHLIDYHDDAEHAVNFHEGDESNTLSKLIKCGKKHKP